MMIEEKDIQIHRDNLVNDFGNLFIKHSQILGPMATLSLIAKLLAKTANVLDSID